LGVGISKEAGGSGKQNFHMNKTWFLLQ
jgi:hypothetical protein